MECDIYIIKQILYWYIETKVSQLNSADNEA